MDAQEITRICLNDAFIAPYFFGCIALDELPYPLPPFSLFIINSQSRSLPGEHWFSLNVDLELPGKCIFVDSFGRPPPSSISKQILKQERQIVYNDFIIQNPLTQVCGSISILFLKLWSHGYTTMDILNQFLPYDQFHDPFKSDAFSNQFISQLSNSEVGQILPNIQNP